MLERWIEGPWWAWMSDNWPVIPVAALVLALAWVTWWEFGRVDEIERSRREEVDDEQ